MNFVSISDNDRYFSDKFQAKHQPANGNATIRNHKKCQILNSYKPQSK